ncbi:MAG: hypothetical protein LH615_09645, partial [Ferruginibacter sp.]|nr:hypothetical protein [Ferruginibacter sp.]
KKGDYVITIPNAIGCLKGVDECENGASINLSNNNNSNNAYIFRPYYAGSIPSRDRSIIFCIRVK